jgi:suppressor for copper-sensitivity B
VWIAVLSTPAMSIEWVQRDKVKFRLLPSKTAVHDVEEIRFGLEIELYPGWQFYSIDPGEYAYAPKFDWSRSENALDISVYWPNPKTFQYSSSPLVITYGYEKNVLLPIVVKLQDTRKGLALKLVLDYAVCNDICLTDKIFLEIETPYGRGVNTEAYNRIRRAIEKITADR